MGAAKITTFVSDLPVDVRVEFDALQNEAQSEKNMIWKQLECTTEEVVKGTVLEVYSGDSIGVWEDGTDRVVRLNVAGIKAPSMGGVQEQEPWA